MYGASAPKILALYAAFQLRSDLRNLIARISPVDGKTLESSAIAEWKAKGFTKQLPDLKWLFDIRKWSAPAILDFTAAARSAFANIVHNCPAGTLIAKVSLPYISSLAWQSGLLRATSSGLWLKAIQDSEVRYVIAILSKLSTAAQHQRYTPLAPTPASVI
jgi:hypothetical protein